MAKHLDVFISSTSIDLPEHREAVVNALLSIGLFPSGMEHWPAVDENPVELCHQKVKDAELFIGIYAHRYGWRPGGPGTPSITEMEYDWAGELGIPRFCFIMNDDHPWPLKKVELEAMADLEAFKARVNQQVRGLFTTPDDLAKQVLAALASYAQKQDLSGLTPYLRHLFHDALQSGLLRTLDARTSDLTFRGKPMTVDQVYTPLDTRIRVLRTEEGQIDWEKTKPSAEELEDETFKARKEIPSPLGAMEAVSHYERLILLGDPGSGKSTLVQFLILGLAGHLLNRQDGWLDKLRDQGWAHDALLPVLVILHDFAQDMGEDHEQGTAQSLLGHLRRGLKKSGCETEIGALQAALRDGHVLLLLDGLDEVPPEKREIVRDAVADLMAAYPCRVLLTCRILSYANPEWQIPDVESATLAPFDEAKIAQFITAWYRAAEALDVIPLNLAQARIEDLIRAASDPRLRDVATNPMLLTVMAIVHNHQGHLPEQTAKLYQDCVEILMLKWRPEDARHLRDILQLAEADLYRILWHVAFYAHETQGSQSGAADLPKAELLDLVANGHFQGSFGRAEQFCQYVEERAGLLIGRGGADGRRRVYAFPHRTFQEFLAGCSIADEMRYLELFAEKARAGANWREVLRLATGHMLFNKLDRNAPIMAAQYLLEDDPITEADWQAVWLAGDMLLLVGLSALQTHPIGKRVLSLARQRLTVLVQEGRLEPVERAGVGCTLAGLGDPRPGVLAPNGVPDFVWCEVSAGWFKMGGDPKAYPSWKGREYDLPYAFWIAKYPVTYVQYEPFVASGAYGDRHYWTEVGWADKGKRTEPYLWNDPKWHISNHPVVGVTWNEAYAYTQWLNAQPIAKPTEAPRNYIIRLARECEWEKAARYPDGRLLPWGNEWDATRINWKESGIGRTCAVGLFQRGANTAHGACDLLGNVQEWCLTQWGEYLSPIREHNDPETEAVRCLRGGSWDTAEQYYLRAATRSMGSLGGMDYTWGFRVVLSIPI